MAQAGGWHGGSDALGSDGVIASRCRFASESSLCPNDALRFGANIHCVYRGVVSADACFDAPDQSSTQRVNKFKFVQPSARERRIPACERCGTGRCWPRFWSSLSLGVTFQFFTRYRRR